MSHDRIEKYQIVYTENYGFERVMVNYRQKFLMERLQKYESAVVVEIGCGSELLYGEWIKSGNQSKYWLIVEPAKQFVEISQASNLPNLHIVPDFFENVVEKINKNLPREPDLIICSSLLHEVSSASDLLAAVKSIMGPNTMLHVNVPNAGSLHRQIAKSMGLIKNLKEMSDLNNRLLQHRVYDMADLKLELIRSGLNVCETGGYMIKPFTHKQMEKISAVIEPPILDGLFNLGKEMPEIASEIFIEACKKYHA